MGVGKRFKYVYNYLMGYPRFGKALSAFFGLLEVPLLDFFEWLHHNTPLDFYKHLMHGMTKIYGSKVIPLNVSIDSRNLVSPSDEILGIVRRVEKLSIGYCYCRNKYKNCNNDVWTCIHVGTAESLSELSTRMPTKDATVEEVEAIIKKANESGLVHQLITAPSSSYFYVICNCCPCCCVMLNSAIRYGIQNTAISSHFIILKDEQKCSSCGKCVSRCHFGVHSLLKDMLNVDTSKCVGCGLCVSTCPEKALTMTRRRGSTG
ncbi:MAG: ATP-binding protein [Candidatus Thorarchaeota archaeon]